MADRTVSVRLLGMSQLVRALKQADEALPGAMREHLLGVAEALAGKVRAIFPRKSGRAAGTIKAQATPRGASIKLGGRMNDYAPWLDFGGSVGRGHVPGKPWSGAIRRTWMGKPVGSGRYLYPTVIKNREETIAAVDEALREVVADAGFETSGSL